MNWGDKHKQKEYPNLYLSLSPLHLHPSRPTPTFTTNRRALPETFENCDPARILIESDQSDLGKTEDGLWECVLRLAEGRFGDPAQDHPQQEGGDEEARIERTVCRLETNWKVWRGEQHEVRTDRFGHPIKYRQSELLVDSEEDERM